MLISISTTTHSNESNECSISLDKKFNLVAINTPPPTVLIDCIDFNENFETLIEKVIFAFKHTLDRNPYKQNFQNYWVIIETIAFKFAAYYLLKIAEVNTLECEESSLVMKWANIKNKDLLGNDKKIFVAAIQESFNFMKLNSFYDITEETISKLYYKCAKKANFHFREDSIKIDLCDGYFEIFSDFLKDVIAGQIKYFIDRREILKYDDVKQFVSLLPDFVYNIEISFMLDLLELSTLSFAIYILLFVINKLQKTGKKELEELSIYLIDYVFTSNILSSIDDSCLVLKHNKLRIYIKRYIFTSVDKDVCKCGGSFYTFCKSFEKSWQSKVKYYN